VRVGHERKFCAECESWYEASAKRADLRCFGCTAKELRRIGAVDRAACVAFELLRRGYHELAFKALREAPLSVLQPRSLRLHIKVLEGLGHEDDAEFFRRELSRILPGTDALVELRATLTEES
jgi:hypothetical protein